MTRVTEALEPEGLAREVGQSLLLLALTGSSVGAILGMVTLATKAMGQG